MPAIKIFVGNLSSDTTADDIRPLFEVYGEVSECDVLRNFGFVHMPRESEANAAINELVGTVVRGQRINVEKSTGVSRGGGGRGDRGGGGKMGGGRGRGRGRGSGGPPGRDYDPYPPPRPHPYGRDPYYDYYDRRYPDRIPPRFPPRHEESRSPYEREDRMIPPRRDPYDPYDSYPPPRYPADRYDRYERFPPPPDPYERPPPDYYRAYDGYDDPRRASPPPPKAGQSLLPGIRSREVANGYEERPMEPPGGGGDSYSRSYSSYYDRFYKPTNGAPGPGPAPSRPPLGRPQQMGGGGASLNPPSMAAQQKNDQQSMLQTGPMYF